MDASTVATWCARQIDRLPVTPATIADRAIAAHAGRRRRNAATDPTWAGIEARRHTGRGTVTFLSDDLTVADWATQERIARTITPEPWWLGVAHNAKTWTAQRAVREVVEAAQRVRRGWADSDVWNLDGHLCRITAEMLDELADIAHSWPDQRYATFEDWQGALRQAAAGLRGEVDGPSAEELHDQWWALTNDPDGDPVAAREALDRTVAHEAAQLDARADALRWVADNLPHLWD